MGHGTCYHIVPIGACKGAGSNNFLAYLWLVLPVSVDGCSIESNDITGSDSRSAFPLKALRSLGLATAIKALALLAVPLGLMRSLIRSLMRSLMRGLERRALLIALGMGCASATDKTILLKWWGTIALLRLAITAKSLLLLWWNILLLWLLIR